MIILSQCKLTIQENQAQNDVVFVLGIYYKLYYVTRLLTCKKIHEIDITCPCRFKQMIKYFDTNVTSNSIYYLTIVLAYIFVKGYDIYDDETDMFSLINRFSVTIEYLLISVCKLFDIFLWTRPISKLHV